MADVSNEVKVSILKQELQIHLNTIYQLTIRAKIANDIGDTSMKDNVVKELEKQAKYKDAYESALKELKEIKEA